MDPNLRGKCTSCGQMMRKHGTTIKQYPGTRNYSASGVCVPCRTSPTGVSKPHFTSDPTYPCEGGCGRTLRQSQFTKADYPGTTRAVRNRKCQGCNNPTKPAKPAKPRSPKPMTATTSYPKCQGECGKPMRKYHVLAHNAPGTVIEKGRGICRTCYDTITATTPPSLEAMRARQAHIRGREARARKARRIAAVRGLPVPEHYKLTRTAA